MSDLVYGPAFDPVSLGEAVVNTLIEWSPAYCAWLSRLIGEDDSWLLVPQSYVITDDPNHWPEDEPPACQVIIPDTTKVWRTGRTYAAEWNVTVAMFVTSASRPDTEQLAKHYATMLRQLLLQQGTLGGVVTNVDWLGEKYNSHIPNAAQRTLGACFVEFCIQVGNVATKFGGPPSPVPFTVPADPPTVTNPTVVVKPLPQPSS